VIAVTILPSACVYVPAFRSTFHGRKGKGKVHPRTGNRGAAADVKLYASFDLGVRWDWVVNITPRPLYPRERPGIHCIGGWVGSRAGIDVCGKSCPSPRDSIPGPFSP